MQTIDEYLKRVDPAQRKTLEEIRAIILNIVPQAEESISYGIPTYKVNKQRLIYFAAFKHHMSIYPALDAMIKAIPELAPFRTSTGTLQFTVEKPISESLLKQIITFRLQALAFEPKGY